MDLLLPTNIKSDFHGYKSFIQLYNFIHQSNAAVCTISFEKTRVFDANLSAILGAIIDILEQQKQISIVNMNQSIRDMLEDNNFIEKSILELKNQNSGNVISFMKFTQYKDIEFMEYVMNEILSKPSFPKHTKMLGKKINESIFELFENARTHGKCNHIYTCGQIIKEEDITRLEFTIVDMGKTIKYNVNEYLNSNLTGSEAIEWAMKSGHTTKTGDVSGGLGLDIIFEFIKLNKGRIQIVSSDGFWEYSNDKTEMKLFEYPFQGTIANIEFNLNDKSSYRLKEEIPLEDIF